MVLSWQFALHWLGKNNVISIVTVSQYKNGLTLNHLFAKIQNRMQNHIHEVPSSCHNKSCSTHSYRVHRKHWLNRGFCCSHGTWNIYDAIHVPWRELARQRTQLHHNLGILGQVELESLLCQWHMFSELNHCVNKIGQVNENRIRLMAEKTFIIQRHWSRNTW